MLWPCPSSQGGEILSAATWCSHFPPKSNVVLGALKSAVVITDPQARIREICTPELGKGLPGHSSSHVRQFRTHWCPFSNEQPRTHQQTPADPSRPRHSSHTHGWMNNRHWAVSQAQSCLLSSRAGQAVRKQRSRAKTQSCCTTEAWRGEGRGECCYSSILRKSLWSSQKGTLGIWDKERC